MRNAGRVRELFRSILLLVSAGSTTCAGVAACSKVVGENATGDDGGADVGSDAIDSGSDVPTNPCRLASPIDASVLEPTYDAGMPDACLHWTGQLTGDLTTCSVPASGDPGVGQGDPRCNAPCGTDGSVGCDFDRSTGVLVCFTSCTGRPHAGLDFDAAPASQGVGGYFARMAYFEAASVDAFDLLAMDIRAHGAPEPLLRAARRARADEQGHARMARTMAKRFAGRSRNPSRPATRAPRDLERIATENAVEGCVRETFGALVGAWQAEHAETTALRTFFDRIARDEARHAALAHRIDAWIMQRLDAASRSRVNAARGAAIRALARELGERTASGPSSVLGYPSARDARSLFARLAPQLQTTAGFEGGG